MTHDARLSRRRLFATAGAAGLVTGAGLTGAAEAVHDQRPPEPLTPAADPRESRRLAMTDHRGAVPAHRHQPGIDTPHAAVATVLALDLDPVSGGTGSARRTFATLLQRLTTVIDRLHSGQAQPAAGPATGLQPASLTITLGLGPRVFELIGRGHLRPGRLVDVPVFAGDQLRPEWSNGDVGLVVSAEDRMVVDAAVQALVDAAHSLAHGRWSLTGFIRTAAASRDPSATPRNIMGHKDGTDNPQPGTNLFDAVVFDRDTETPAWMRGGSYLIVRRIRVLLDSWYRLDISSRSRVIGRHAVSGAPLGEEAETDPVDLTLTNADGRLAIPADAHIRLANPQNSSGARIYRRAYSYDLGWRADGTRDTGELFMTWQANPEMGFIPIQRSLVRGSDALSRFTRHEGSAIFAAPPRPAAGEYFAQRLAHA